MAISFPSSPNDGDLYSAVGRTWQYNATAGAWESLSESNVTLTSLGISNLDQLNLTATGEYTGSLIPDTDVAYDLGSATNRWRDLYLSGNSIELGNRTITQDNIPDVDLAIAPEILEIQVSAPQAGQDTQWLWTWLTSSLPYARRDITNSPEVQVPLYKQGTYTVNNFAAYDLFGDMTQTHSLYLKWIDGAGTDNLVSWATTGGPFSDSHPDINGGASTDVQRISISVPASVTPPTLTAPSVSYTVENNGAGAYTFSGAAKGDNPNLGPFYRGGTYTVNITASGHPFYFTTDNGTNFVSGTYFGEYTDGVTGSRTDSGTITFTVPNDAPDTLYYQCGNHSVMRGAITVKDLAVETNNNGNYIVYFQHTQEGHKTPVEIRPIPSLVNQMCLVYDAGSGKFVPQDLATYVENTPSFENKIREVAGTAELVVEDGSTVVAKVNVYDDSTYLPLVGNNPGDQAFATDTNVLYIWDGSAWQQAGTTNSDDLTEGTTNLFFTDARADARAAIAVSNLVDNAPTTLDTLNELAAALGDDPNFATTVSTNIGTKLATADFDSTFDTRLATKDTDDITEGSNQYFTQARVQSTPINAGSLRGSVNNATVQYGTNYSGTPAQGSFFFDSLNQKLKIYTGSAFVDAVPAGSGGGGGEVTDANATFAKYTYTISSSTNSVSGADDNLETLSYTVSSATNVEAYVNGVKQTEGASNDYVATTGTSVTFTYNIPAGSTVDIQVYELLTNDAYYLKTETYTRTETNSQISTALAGLVDSAPTTLDTLNELAAALGDDPNFATTVTNSIADKLPLSGGTLTGALIGTNARFDNTATTPVRVHINNSGTNDYGLIYADTATAYKNLVINPNGGNVGIGTANPRGKFEVSGGSGSTGVQSYFSVQAGYTDPAAGNASHPGGAKLILWDDTNTPQKASIGMSGNADIWFNNAGGQGGAGFTFYTGNGASVTPEARLKITKDGNVGIGTTDPKTTLETGYTRVYNSGVASSPTSGKGLEIHYVTSGRTQGEGSYLISYDRDIPAYKQFTIDASNIILSGAGNNVLTADTSAVNVERPLGLPQYSSNPTGTRAGQMYWNTVSSGIKFYDGSNWSNITVDLSTFTDLLTTSMPHSGINVDEAGIRGGTGNWSAATDNNITTTSNGFGWHDGHEGAPNDWPAYIAVYIGTPKPVNQLQISIHSNSFGDFELQGSNNANTSGTFYNTGNWTSLTFNTSGSSFSTQTGGGYASGYGDGTVFTYNYDNSTEYTHYRIWFKNATKPGTSQYLGGWAGYGWRMNRV